MFSAKHNLINDSFNSSNALHRYQLISELRRFSLYNAVLMILREVMIMLSYVKEIKVILKSKIEMDYAVFCYQSKTYNKHYLSLKYRYCSIVEQPISPQIVFSPLHFRSCLLV